MAALHPGEFVPVALAEEMRGFAKETELLRDLHAMQWKIIHDQKWLKMFVPESYGGLALSLPKALRIEESLAWIDGSTAWVVTLCSGAGWFIGFLEEKLRKEFFIADELCIAGSGAPTGTAEATPNGYVINGSWKYASGALHATALTANCVITRNGKPEVDQHGNQRVEAFIFHRSEVEIDKSWNTIGMIPTGSHNFRIRDLSIPSNRAFHIDKKFAKLTDPLYQYPFLQFAETTLAVNYSGMAIRFLELAKHLNSSRRIPDHDTFDRLYDRVIEDIQIKRNHFYEVADHSYRILTSGIPIPIEVLEKVSNVSHDLYFTSISSVDTIYPLTGLGAANPETEINRVWRNIHTASQHSLFGQGNA